MGPPENLNTTSQPDYGDTHGNCHGHDVLCEKESHRRKIVSSEAAVVAAVYIDGDEVSNDDVYQP